MSSRGPILLALLNFTLHQDEITPGYADLALFYGIPGDRPVAGDWDGDGIDTIGVYRWGVFYLGNSNTSGYSDLAFSYGAASDKPVVGDWDGDGTGWTPSGSTGVGNSCCATAT